jgi:DNA processing protein
MTTLQSHENSAAPTALAAAAVDELLGALNDVEQKNAPARLYFRGDRRLLQDGPRVSLVGSRSATAEGLRRAAKLARALVARGVVVVSGLAEGIDTAAHEAAMQAGGRTIAVLGSPVEVAYPASNKALLELIAKDHLVVSQFAASAPIQPKNFPMRNRTMALLSHATVIVEAAEKSGTIHQAWEALRLGRPLFLLESIVKNPELTWPKEVQGYGAQVLSDSTFDEMVEQLPAGHYEGAVAF